MLLSKPAVRQIEGPPCARDLTLRSRHLLHATEIRDIPQDITAREGVSLDYAVANETDDVTSRTHGARNLVYRGVHLRRPLSSGLVLEMGPNLRVLHRPRIHPQPKHTEPVVQVV